MALTYDRWTCPECGDTMHVKFQRSHVVLCHMASLLMKRDVDTLIHESEEYLDRR